MQTAHAQAAPNKNNNGSSKIKLNLVIDQRLDQEIDEISLNALERCFAVYKALTGGLPSEDDDPSMNS